MGSLRRSCTKVRELSELWLLRVVCGVNRGICGDAACYQITLGNIVINILISSLQQPLAHLMRTPTLPALTTYPRRTSPSLRSATLITSLSLTSTADWPTLIALIHSTAAQQPCETQPMIKAKLHKEDCRSRYQSLVSEADSQQVTQSRLSLISSTIEDNFAASECHCWVCNSE